MSDAFGSVHEGPWFGFGEGDALGAGFGRGIQAGGGIFRRWNLRDLDALGARLRRSGDGAFGARLAERGEGWS